MLNRIGNTIRSFMTGRYGSDQLNIAALILGVALAIIFSAFDNAYLVLISYIPLAIVIFRMLSRNITKRRAENAKFMKFWQPVKSWFLGIPQFFRDRKTHRFYKCPKCAVTVRVPKSKGKINITCPKCGERFVKKT